jgi:hypothetical protein
MPRGVVFMSSFLACRPSYEDEKSSGPEDARFSVAGAADAEEAMIIPSFQVFRWFFEKK